MNNNYNKNTNFKKIFLALSINQQFAQQKKKQKNFHIQNILIIEFNKIINNIENYTINISISNILDFFLFKYIFSSNHFFFFIFLFILRKNIIILCDSFLESFTSSIGNISRKNKTKYSQPQNIINNIINTKISKQLIILQTFLPFFFIFISSITMFLLFLIQNNIIHISQIINLFYINTINKNYIFIQKIFYEHSAFLTLVIIIILFIIIYNSMIKYLLEKQGILSFYKYFIYIKFIILIISFLIKNTIKINNFYFFSSTLIFYYLIQKYILDKYKHKYMNYGMINNLQNNILKNFDIIKALYRFILIYIRKLSILIIYKIVFIQINQIINNFYNLTNKFQYNKNIYTNILKYNQFLLSFFFFILILEQNIINNIKKILKFHIRIIHYINQSFFNKITMSSLSIISIKFSLFMGFFNCLISIFFIINIYFLNYSLNYNKQNSSKIFIKILKNINILKYYNNKKHIFLYCLLLLVIIFITQIIKFFIYKYHFLTIFIEIKQDFEILFLSHKIYYLIIYFIYFSNIYEKFYNIVYLFFIKQKILFYANNIIILYILTQILYYVFLICVLESIEKFFMIRYIKYDIQKKNNLKKIFYNAEKSFQIINFIRNFYNNIYIFTNIICIAVFLMCSSLFHLNNLLAFISITIFQIIIIFLLKQIFFFIYREWNKITKQIDYLYI